MPRGPLGVGAGAGRWRGGWFLASEPFSRNRSAPALGVDGSPANATGFRRFLPTTGFDIALTLWVLVAAAGVLFAAYVAETQLLSADVGLWTVFDWLTNYQGGFVRRGLCGEIILRIGDATGLPPQTIAVAIILALYGVLYTLAIRLFLSLRDRGPALLLIFAPFLLMFEPLSRMAFGRKEILLVIAIAALAGDFARRREDRPSWAPEIALALFPLAVLSHEAVFLYSPYLLFFALVGPRPAARRWLAVGLWLVSGVTFGLAIAFHGDAQTVAGICDSLAPRLGLLDMPNACLQKDSQIVWLAHDAAYGLNSFMRQYAANSVATLAPALLLTLAAFAPLTGFFQHLWTARRAVAIWLAGCAGLAVVMSLPLFVVATDWGRWMRIHAVAFGMISIALLAREQKAGWTSAHTAIFRSRPFLLAVALYATMWQLRPVGRLVGGGFSEKVLTILVRPPRE